MIRFIIQAEKPKEGEGQQEAQETEGGEGKTAEGTTEETKDQEAKPDSGKGSQTQTDEKVIYIYLYSVCYNTSSCFNLCLSQDITQLLND